MTLDQIGALVGIHRSSIHRHSKRCLIRQKASQVRAILTRSYADAQQIVCWPDRDPNALAVKPADIAVRHHGRPYHVPGDSDFQNDTFIMIEYEDSPGHIHNKTNAAPADPAEAETSPLN